MPANALGNICVLVRLILSHEHHCKDRKLRGGGPVVAHSRAPQPILVTGVCINTAGWRRFAGLTKPNTKSHDLFGAYGQVDAKSYLWV